MHVRTGAADGTNRFTDVAYIAEVAALAALIARSSSASAIAFTPSFATALYPLRVLWTACSAGSVRPPRRG